MRVGLFSRYERCLVVDDDGSNDAINVYDKLLRGIINKLTKIWVAI